MPSSPVNTGKKLRSIGLGILLGVILCELVLRIYNPIPSSVKNGKLLLPANQQKVFTNTWISKLDKKIHYSKNSLGFRGPELPPDPNKLITIITVGGSTTECKYLSDSSTWPARLYQQLHRANSAVWLNNAGIDGHTTFGHLALIRDYILKLKPRYMLLMTGVNDVELDAADEFDLATNKEVNTGSAKAFLKSLANHTELGRALLNYYQLRVSFKKGLVHREIKLNELTDNPLTDTVVRARLVKQTVYLAAYRQRIDSVIRLCRGAGIQPVLITQPSLYGSYTDPVTGIAVGNKWFSKDASGENCSLMEKILESYNDVLRSFSGEVPVIDLSRMMPKSSVYFYDFTHVTNAGAEKIAALLAAALDPVLFKKQINQ